MSDDSSTNGPWQSVNGPLLPYGRQSITEEDIAAVTDTLRSERLTQGPLVEAFEAKMSERTGARHAIALSSGTAALHLGALALDLGPGKSLWTTPNTFVATANCARYCGAAVDFVDIDPQTWNMSAAALAAKLAAAEKDGTLPAVVAPVHFAGQSCPMADFRPLSEKYGFRLLEDASHAVGASYRDQPVGSCRYSDLATFSFHPVKIVTTGEGGLALTNDDALAAKLASLRTHGITRDETLLENNPPDGPWSYEQLDLGYNYRITDIQCALGLAQVDRLDTFIARRRELAARYDDLLAGLPLSSQAQHPDGLSSWHLYPIRLDLDAISKTRREVFEELQARGIGVQVHYIPVHTQPYYRRLADQVGQFPEAEAFYEGAISLPLFYGLTDSDQDRVAAILREILA